MATLKHVQSRRMYSWWWDSHISPKNSKWLQENLTDMDVKVKQMIKLIEEDADSFARRAEMYYKKRPELMRMVEEFYRAYRALAERYDNATGLIRQAHRTMIEGLPNQVPGDDSPAMADDPDELAKDSSIFQGGKKNEFGGRRERMSFSFVDDDEREQQKEMVNLKESLAKLEAEKVAGLLQYQRSLENLSNLEKEFVLAQEDSKTLNERASKAEAESQALTEDLRKSKLEREACLLQYQQCLDRIAKLEKNLTQLQEQYDDLNGRANRAEVETQAVKDQISIAETEKEAVLIQKNQLLLKISDLEKKLLQAKENVRKITEQANKAESEVKTQKQSLSKLAEEKEAASLQYKKCLETISILERQLSCAQEEAQRLNSEITDGILKIKGAEERCFQLDTSNQSLSSELADLMHKMATQDEELTHKQHELGTLLSSVQEEHMRFLDIESSFKNLQHLHTQSQEELKSLNVELQQRDKALNQLQIHNNELQVEVQKAKEENLSSAISIKDMQDELGILRAARQKLEEEVEIRVGQRNTLQQEIYSLKEEINGLNNKHQAVIDRVDSVGMNVDSFGSAVKELQDDHSKLREVCEKEKSEKVVLCEKLEKLLEKNAVLENSISGLSEEMQAMRVKVKQLEELCQFYMGEKSVLFAEKQTIFSQLQITTENLGKLSEKNAFLENSLVDANGELEQFREKTQRLEDSCKLLDTEKSVVVSEKENLFSQLQISHQKLEDLVKKYSELEETHACLEKEKHSAFCKVDELKTSMEVEKQEHARISHLSTTHLANLESRLFLLQDKCEKREKELEEKLDEAVNAQIEIFILQRCVRDLEHENFEQHMKVKSSLDQINKMWIWIYRVLKALDTDSYHGSDDIMDRIIFKIDEKECSLSKTMDDNQQLILENLVLSTLLEQMQLMGEKLQTEKNTHYQELKTRIKELLVLQNEHRSLEDENYCISKEVIALSFLSLILKNTVIEKSVEMKRLSENLDQIQGVSGVKEKKLKVMEGNLEMAGVENHRLGELLHQKEVDCLEAEKKFSALQNEHRVLQNLMENQKCEFDEVKLIKEIQEKRIQTLEVKFFALEEEHEESKFIENTLNYELEKSRNEADLWEIEGTTFFSEMQISAIYGTIFAEKIHELTETCQRLEDKSIYSSKEIELLKERVGALEDKNGKLEGQLASCIPAITSLDRSIASLENFTIHRLEVDKPGIEKKMKDDDPSLHLHPSTSGELNVPEEYIDLQGLETRIKAIEKAMLETERLAVQEKLNKNWEIDSNSGNCPNLRNQTHEISEAGNETLTKDIMLDQISESSPYNRIESIKADDQMLELWETNNHNGSIDLKVGKSPNMAAPAEPTLYHEIKAARRLNSRNPSSERFSGKDLSIDKLEISRRFSETRQEGGNKKSILERLASDAQKLTNLQITVQDLIKMVEITEKNKKGKCNIEFSNVKEQLEESEDAILKLLDINKTLMNKAEEKSATDSDESSYIRKRRVSDQARKGSEKIGRLQIEVQKLQFLLLKLDGEKEKNKGKTRVAERRTRVLLRDYLYGGMIRPGQRKKKASFCACVRSPTKDD